MKKEENIELQARYIGHRYQVCRGPALRTSNNPPGAAVQQNTCEDGWVGEGELLQSHWRGLDHSLLLRSHHTDGSLLWRSHHTHDSLLRGSHHTINGP